ncbi:hypothetical protein EDD18DRAFT_1351631 [Armillaria luteobubalina]|uniref:Uncharacterized protein n=1 Tax=Armillaria luteobubalina TaxID=153913 RepID=A0AA39UPH4_9AGAR|nr:hypothetical protein EDD18DRAFT_1351631 [Armillaria luteobubalina]
MPLVNVSIDDTQTDFLKYGGSWTNNGTYNASDIGETGTLSFTKDFKANVTFTFPRPANAFYYYGIRRCCGGEYNICIDCDDLDSFILQKVDAVNTTDDGKNPPALLFSKHFDTPGLHTITLENRHDKRFGGYSELTLDRFVLQVESNALALSERPTSASETSSPISTAPKASNSDTAALAVRSRLPIGAIVGGVLGGAVLCLIIWIFMCRRRRHTQRYSLTAYTVTDATSDYISRKVTVVGGPSASNGALSGRTHPPPPRMGVASPGGRLPRHETDAGRIDIDTGDDFGTLPPQYEMVFSSGRLNSEQSVTRGLSRESPRHEPRRPLPLTPSGASGLLTLQPMKF